jgi:hypothetical protein
MEQEKTVDFDNNLDTSVSYDDYIIWCSLEGIIKPLTASEFEQLLLDVKNDELDTDRLNGLGFVPAIGGGGLPPRRSVNLNSRYKPKPNNVSISGMRGAPDIIAKGMGVWDQINNPNSTTRSAARQAINTMRGIKQIFDGMGGNVNTGGTPNIPGMRESSDGPRGALLFNVKPNPIEISYSPAIPNTVYADTYRQVKDRDANLYMTSVYYQVPVGDSTVTDYVKKVLIPNLELRANTSSSFNTNAYINFTYSKVISYIETVANALLTYFSLTNIISYCANGGKNTAMWALKEMISAEDILLIDTLGERLTNMPIPPRLKEQLYWMTNVYKATNNVPNSPILLMTGMAFDSPAIDAEGDYYFTGMSPKVQFYIDALRPTAVSTTDFDMRMLDMMSNIMPGWLNQGIGPGFGIPVHDGHWYDVWMNSPHTSYTGGNVHTVPNTTNINEDIDYISVNDDFSGISQYLFSAYYDSSWSGAIEPALSTISSDGVIHSYTNRFVFKRGMNNTSPDGALYPYYSANPTGSFVSADFQLSQSGWFNHINQSSNASPSHNITFPGPTTQAVRGVNILANQKPSLESTQWIMSFDEAFSGAKKLKDERKGNPKRDRRRNPKKDLGKKKQFDKTAKVDE